MTATHRIEGVLPVVNTVYRPDQTIDYAILERQVDGIFEAGAQGLCLALVSDLLRLTAAERLDLPGRLVEWTRGRGPVVISVGSESTIQACQFARAAADAGASAVMAIPPLSQPLPEEELRRYYAAILDEVEIPLLVQDASSYVGQAMSVEFQASLHLHYGERILFKPEATPLGPCISALRDQTEGRAGIFEGSGGVLLMDAYRRGIRGTIPGVELLEGLVALWDALERGDDARAYAIYFPVSGVVSLQLQGGLDGFIVVERHLMRRRGLIAEEIHRGPLGYDLDAETRAEVDRLFSLLQEALGRGG